MKRVWNTVAVTGFGLVASILTALVLVVAEAQSHIAIYTYMFFFIVPIGAIASGWVAASGYVLGARIVNHRPDSSIRFYMIGVSVLTFFLIKFLQYMRLTVEGIPIHHLVSFAHYLHLSITHMVMQSASANHPSGARYELGYGGYLVAVLQIFGFALGGLMVYGLLLSQNYCAKCSRFYRSTGKQVRYYPDLPGVKGSAEQLKAAYESDNLSGMITLHTAQAQKRKSRGMEYRTIIELQRCPDCAINRLSLHVEERFRSIWQVLPEYTRVQTTDQALSV